QALVALDDCADYAPQQIPAGRHYRGHGYLKGHGPRLIRTWTLDDTAVQALPVSVRHELTSHDQAQICPPRTPICPAPQRKPRRGLIAKRCGAFCETGSAA
ncbi:hypothetical protein E7Y31_22105, partial [Candidatus Frankia alpina]